MPSAESNKLAELKQKAITAIDTNADELIELSRRIHANPELAFKEEKAAQWIGELLTRYGFSVQKGIGDMPTAFRGIHEGTDVRPRVAMLAEYDALPEIGHACGHNLMAVIGPAAGIAVTLADPAHPGIISIIGTPAEENGGGKVILSKKGIFKEYDAAMLVHPACYYEVDYHSIGCQTFRVEFFGKSAHASAAPEKGINALDAMIHSFNMINAMRQHVKPDVRIHGIITNGGKASNIVPDYSSGEFTVRSVNDDYMDELVDKVTRIFEAAAAATGCTVKYDFNESRYAAMVTNKILANAFADNMRTLGITVQERDSNRGMGSSDIGNVSHECPTIEGWFKIAEPDIGGHTHEFREAAQSERGFKALLDAAKTMAMTTLDILYNDSLREQIKQEFQSVSPIKYRK